MVVIVVCGTHEVITRHTILVSIAAMDGLDEQTELAILKHSL